MIPPASEHPADASGLHVLIATRWYPAFDDPLRGSFIADQVAALRAVGVDVVVASWETALSTRRIDALGASVLATPQPWLDAIRERSTAVIPRSWGAAHVPVCRLPAVERERVGASGDQLAVADRQAETLVAFGVRLAERWPIDLIHAHTGLPDGLAAASLAERLGVPLVVTEHDSTLANRLASDRARQAYRSLTGPRGRLIAVSEPLRRQMVDLLGISSSAIDVIPNTVDVDAFPLVGPQARDAQELLWVGSRQASKGTDTLLNAFRLLLADQPGLRLRLLGRAPSPAEEARLRDLARELEVADAVSFEPAADRATVAAAMGRAAVFVHPSPHETFGVVAAEALASGLPVAALRSGGVAEILGDEGDNGEIAATNDAPALAAAVRRVLDRRSSFDTATMRARIERRYAPSAVGSTLNALYRDLVPPPGSTRAERIPGASVVDPVGIPAQRSTLPLVVGMRRRAAIRRVGGLTPQLAASLFILTASEPPKADAVPLPLGPTWLEVDVDRGYREALGRLGGPLGRGSLPVRLARVARHPFRALRRRRLTADRERLDLVTTRAAIRDAIAALEPDRTHTEVLPLDADDVELVAPLLDARTRLYPTTLRGLADRWDAERQAVRTAATVQPSDVGETRYTQRV